MMTARRQGLKMDKKRLTPPAPCGLIPHDQKILGPSTDQVIEAPTTILGVKTT